MDGDELAALKADLMVQQTLLEWFFYALLDRQADVLETFLEVAACLLPYLETEVPDPRSVTQVATFTAVLRERWEKGRADGPETPPPPGRPSLTVIEGGKTRA